MFQAPDTIKLAGWIQYLFLDFWNVLMSNCISSFQYNQAASNFLHIHLQLTTASSDPNPFLNLLTTLLYSPPSSLPSRYSNHVYFHAGSFLKQKTQKHCAHAAVLGRKTFHSMVGGKSTSQQLALRRGWTGGWWQKQCREHKNEQTFHHMHFYS